MFVSPGAPCTASQGGSYCAGLPEGSVPEKSDTLKDAPTRDFMITDGQPVPNDSLELLSWENHWTDAQPRESPYFEKMDHTEPVEPSKETTVPEPTPPGEVASASSDKVSPEAAGAEPSPATPTPTVAESTVGGSPPGSPSPHRSSRRGKSPTYFRFLGGDFAKHAVPNQILNSSQTLTACMLDTKASPLLPAKEGWGVEMFKGGTANVENRRRKFFGSSNKNRKLNLHISYMKTHCSSHNPNTGSI